MLNFKITTQNKFKRLKIQNGGGYFQELKFKEADKSSEYDIKKKSPAPKLCRPPKHLKYTMKNLIDSKVVGATGFEPVTPCL